MKIIKVLTELNTSALDSLYSYYVDDSQEIFLYTRVKIKFGSKDLIGFVLEINHYDISIEEYNASLSYQVKKVSEIIDRQPLLTKELIELGKTVAKNTFSLLIACYQAFLPSALKPKSGKETKIKYIDTFYPDQEIANLPPKKNQCYNFILNNPGLIKKEIPFSSSIINQLCQLRAIKIQKVESYRLKLPAKFKEPAITLNEDQQQAITKINQSEGTFLLHGVTGSGKTEVYINVINQTLSQGKTAIILVPEIGLTPQLLQKYINRLNGKIALIHSGLSSGEKYDEYRRILNKDASVVLGTRSAIFAPLENIGVIILDEEHSFSYKQETTPRYHARDVALLRAKYHHAKLILGSATPSLESYSKAYLNQYHLILLPNRVKGLKMPSVKIVDMQEQARGGNFSLLSTDLKQLIADRLQKKEQVILLLNRKGYSSITTCQVCGYIPTCPHCRISLTYDKENKELYCNNCGFDQDCIYTCPVCRSKFISYYGSGTQKLEETLRKEFLEARICRFDGDSISGKGSHQTAIEDFANQKFDILFGTQIVSKGLDFPNVTLVGIINAEQGLSLPFYWASEQNFQLIVQTIGRAGRAKEGRAIIQSLKPNNYSIVLAAKQDYFTFFKKEMSLRKERNYPPYFKVLSIILKSEEDAPLFALGNKIVETLKSLDQTLLITGPNFPYIKKHNFDFVVKISVKYKSIEKVQDYLESLIKKTNKKIGLYINVNPSEEL